MFGSCSNIVFRRINFQNASDTIRVFKNRGKCKNTKMYKKFGRVEAYGNLKPLAKMMEKEVLDSLLLKKKIKKLKYDVQVTGVQQDLSGNKYYHVQCEGSCCDQVQIVISSQLHIIFIILVDCAE